MQPFGNMKNVIKERLLPAVKNGGFRDNDYLIWCGSVIKGEDGRYHMFASRWKRELGFGSNWPFRCEIVRAAADTPKGPF
ncbi:MAG: glycosyl hydrolase family 43, partial [Clostridia bacterium]|nr:glycosyl hydrolase family 43 [Clostridia bacterium]